MSPIVKNPLKRAVRFLRSGYPEAAPPRGYITVLALMPPVSSQR
jgi:hypothetical protein